MFSDEFGDEFVTKFGESPKLVKSLVANLLMNFVNHGIG